MRIRQFTDRRPEKNRMAIDKYELKKKHLTQLKEYQKELCLKPQLRHLFLELTLRCNEHCFHCGSYCGDIRQDEMSFEDYRRILDEVKEDFDIRKIQLCITGGEPLLRKDFFEILGYAHSLGYRWGMTSNATLIDRDTAHRLALTGMRTISVSIDGLEETHDRLRGMKGGYRRAMEGIRNLIDEDAFESVQVTTVVNHGNIGELDELFEIMDGLDIDSWRVIHLEPIGRALLRPEMMLTKEDYIRLFDFIREKRRQGYPLEFGCSHYLGPEYEAEVREWYWLCNAGVYTASIMANGDIGACLDIERRSETIQGNIYKDRFSDVWHNRFEIFRRDFSRENQKCRECGHAGFCRGDARHSWDYDNMHPMVCMKDILF